MHWLKQFHCLKLSVSGHKSFTIILRIDPFYPTLIDIPLPLSYTLPLTTTTNVYFLPDLVVVKCGKWEREIFYLWERILFHCNGRGGAKPNPLSLLKKGWTKMDRESVTDERLREQYIIYFDHRIYFISFLYSCVCRSILLQQERSLFFL